ncbi:MAG: hypothetical protein QOD94_306 [Alphaproteobacteria bacterium]|nr:hypothetical protein [Alphaproteobacteria bacterium]
MDRAARQVSNAPTTDLTLHVDEARGCPRNAEEVLRVLVVVDSATSPEVEIATAIAHPRQDSGAMGTRKATARHIRRRLPDEQTGA